MGKLIVSVHSTACRMGVAPFREGDDSFVDRVTSDRPEALSPASGPVYLTGLGDALVRLPR